MTERVIENLSDAIAEQIAATLEALAKERRDLEARVRELESQGYRITDGGALRRIERGQASNRQ
jgi:hypothetical protein